MDRRLPDHGRRTDPNLPEFTRDCDATALTAAPFSPAVEAAILQRARDEHTQVVVVDMPMSSTHRRIYYATPTWRLYRAYLQQRLQADGVTYLEAADWVPVDADFRDGVHLNAVGATVFSTRIAQTLAAQ